MKRRSVVGLLVAATVMGGVEGVAPPLVAAPASTRQQPAKKPGKTPAKKSDKAVKPAALLASARRGIDDESSSTPVTAPPRGMTELKERPARVQTMLARVGFSPGLIDGKPGAKTKVAINTYETARGFGVSAGLGDSTLSALEEESGFGRGGRWTRQYTITAKDIELITGPIPEDWNQRAELTISGYADLEELLAERGWCSVDIVRSLNPEVALSELPEGAQVTLPDVGNQALPKLSELEIDLAAKLVKGVDADGKVVTLMHCSIAKDVDKRPVGELKVKVVADAPDYTFDPAYWPEVTNVDKKLIIAPGPRNPVGTAWIGLDKPGYGIHGTVRPQDIGKTASHGCFRLCNWDASRLARAVKTGMTVRVME